VIYEVKAAVFAIRNSLSKGPCLKCSSNLGTKTPYIPQDTDVEVGFAVVKGGQTKKWMHNG
jgi:hypothetical protein